MTTTRHRQLPGGDPAIVYTEGGSEHGQPLVLLHGLSANATSWAPVIVAHRPGMAQLRRRPARPRTVGPHAGPLPPRGLRRRHRPSAAGDR